MNSPRNILKSFFSIKLLTSHCELKKQCLCLFHSSIIIFHPVGHKPVVWVLCLSSVGLINPGTWLFLSSPSSFLLHLKLRRPLPNPLFPSPLCFVFETLTGSWPGIRTHSTLPRCNALPCPAPGLLRSAQARLAKQTSTEKTATHHWDWDLSLVFESEIGHLCKDREGCRELMSPLNYFVTI